MIYSGSYLEIYDKNYDEIWMIVRKPEELPGFVKHVPELSSSIELFQKYRDVFYAGGFDETFFSQVYVPLFLKDLSENVQALSVLEQLVDISREKDVFLGCYCEDERLCHRSIIAGVLLEMHAKIKAAPTYIKYFQQLERLKNRE